MPEHEGYPKIVTFEARGPHKGRSFKAGAHYVVRGTLELSLKDPEQEALVCRGLADFCVYPAGADVPAHVLEHEKNQPPEPEVPGGAAPNEALAHTKPPYGGEWPAGGVASAAPAPKGKGGKKGASEDLPGAVS